MSALRRIFIAALVAALAGFSAVAITACDVDPISHADGVEVGLSLTERDLQPGRVEVKAGEVEFIVRNDGDRRHAFAVEAPGGTERTEDIKPGETARVAVDLSDGRYRMYDPRERGISGVVVVTSDGGGGR